MVVGLDIEHARNTHHTKNTNILKLKHLLPPAPDLNIARSLSSEFGDGSAAPVQETSLFHDERSQRLSI